MRIALFLFLSFSMLAQVNPWKRDAATGTISPRRAGDSVAMSTTVPGDTRLGDAEIAFWGDSFTEQNNTGTSYVTQLAASLGNRYLYNGGVSGQTSTQIRTRMTAATDKAGWITVIEAGTNNFSDATTVKADIAAMVAALSAPKRYLVLSVFPPSTAPQGSADYAAATQLNSDLATIYGSNYYDMRSYLVSRYDPEQPQDVTDHGNDVIPASLRYDVQHLNTAGYALFASKLQELLAPYFATGNSIVTQSSIRQMFATPYSIGGSKPAHGRFLSLSLSKPDLTDLAIIWSDHQANIYFGYRAGFANTISGGANGLYNSYLGSSSGAANTTGNNNTALGYQALKANTSGTYNVAVGAGALAAHTTGNTNAAVGYFSLAATTTGSGNVGVGNYAAGANLTGANNVAVGNAALSTSTAGNRNSAFGTQALNASTADENTAIGYQALKANTSGGNNTAVGHQALLANTTAWLSKA